MIKREYLNGFIEYDNRKEERCMRKMRTLFLVLLCCGLSLYAGVSYVKAEEKVPSDYDAYLQETGMPENEIQKLDEHVKQFIVDDLKNGDGKFEYMKIDVGKQAMNGREEDFEWIEFYASAFQIGSTIYIYAANASATQTINLSGSKGFTTVSVKNGTLIYSAPAAAESITVSGGTLLLSYSDTTQGDLAISGGSFGATMDGGNAKVKSLAYSGGKLVFATDGFYGGLPNSIAVEGKFSKETLEKVVIDFSGLDAESLIGVPAMTLITAGSFEGMSTSVDADEYFAAENLINAIADFAWNGNSLTVAFAQVPEPAAIAAVFGALALALAARRRGK